MTPTRIVRPEDVGAILRGYRHDHSLSQTELAQKLRVSQRWVSHAENGKSTLHLGLVLRAFNELGIGIMASANATSPAPAQTRSKRRLTDIDSIVDD